MEKSGTEHNKTGILWKISDFDLKIIAEASESDAIIKSTFVNFNALIWDSRMCNLSSSESTVLENKEI